MKTVLFEDEKLHQLLPLVYFRPVWELRCGAYLLREKMQATLEGEFYFLSRKYLQEYYLDKQKIFSELADFEDVLLINGRWVMNAEEVVYLNELAKNAALFRGDDVLAFRTTVKEARRFLNDNNILNAGKVLLNSSLKEIPAAKVIQYPWDAIGWNGEEIKKDYGLLNESGRIAGMVYDGVHIAGRDNVTIRETAVVKPGVVIDAENGPVWIDEGATIMPNSVLEGPLYVGKKSTIKIGAKIYENTSIGPVCKIGGEVEGCIIQGYSNKQHDGFLGHAYLGSWVNLGADTNNSDLKNNYGIIRVLVNGKPVDTGQRFVGLMMGDHSKSAINTMFNTGTIVGVNCNIFGAGMPPKFVPSFSWGGADGLTEYNFDKTTELAKTVMGRRKIEFTDRDKMLFAAVRELAKQVEEGTLLR